LARTIPQLAAGADTADAVETFLRELALYVAGRVDSRAPLRETAEVLDRRVPNFARFLVRFRDAACDVMRPFFWATALSQRDLCDRRLIEAIAALEACVCPRTERRFLVG
jgi:hypothetical protein